MPGFAGSSAYYLRYMDPVSYTHLVTEDESKQKFYVLNMFPYPSGAGLHVGDVYKRQIIGSREDLSVLVARRLFLPRTIMLVLPFVSVSIPTESPATPVPVSYTHLVNSSGRRWETTFFPSCV